MNKISIAAPILVRYMKLSKKDFQVLELLDSQEIFTQRQLSEQTSISLGQVNNILKSLLGKGLIKIGNFRKIKRRIGYVYILTPKGLEVKSRLAVGFVVSRLKEYQQLRRRVTERLSLIEDKGYFQIIFVGPEIVKAFVDSIIKEKALKLVIDDYCRRWEDLKEYEPDSFDIALLFDDNAASRKEMAKDTGIPWQKLMPLL